MDKNFVKEIKNELRRDKILNFIVSNKFNLLLAVLVIAIVVGSVFSYRLYYTHKANVYSKTFALAKEALYMQDYEQAVALLDDLIKKSNNGYTLLAYMQKASVYQMQNDIPKTIIVLQDAIKNIKVSTYYKDMLRLSLLNLQLNSNLPVAEKLQLAKEVKDNINSRSSFYYNMLEIYGAVLVENNQHSEAIQVYSTIENAQDVNLAIKDRSTRIKNFLLSYK